MTAIRWGGVLAAVCVVALVSAGVGYRAGLARSARRVMHPPASLPKGHA